MRPASDAYGSWTLRESYRPSNPAFPDGSIGRYWLTVQREIGAQENVATMRYEGIRLLERIERLWPLAVGVAMGRGSLGPKLRLLTEPTGWTSNHERLNVAVNSARGHTSLSVGQLNNRTWFKADWLPLPRVVEALVGYDTADDLTKELTELLYAAYTSNSSRARVVLLAKALEIVREMLPGRTDAQRERALPDGIREAMTQDLHSLFWRSNSRRETRHPITRVPTLALHPAMEAKEHAAFLKDADTVIRAVACTRLGMGVVVDATDNAQSA
jgi:hypothetical protein